MLVVQNKVKVEKNNLFTIQYFSLLIDRNWTMCRTEYLSTSINLINTSETIKNVVNRKIYCTSHTNVNLLKKTRMNY